MKKLSIIIPAYNEGNTIHFILNKVKSVQLIGGLEKEIIIVNDCSKDHTEEAIKSYITQNPELNIQYYKHEINKGKGAALHTGISKAKGVWDTAKTIYDIGSKVAPFITPFLL